MEEEAKLPEPDEDHKQDDETKRKLFIEPLFAGDVPEYYTNVMACRSARYDAVLAFGIDNQEAGVKPVVRVRMSIEHLAAMIQPLLIILDRFQKNVGSMPGLTLTAEQKPTKVIRARMKRQP
jgi:hypothetical protein